MNLPAAVTTIPGSFNDISYTTHAYLDRSSHCKRKNFIYEILSKIFFDQMLGWKIFSFRRAVRLERQDKWPETKLNYFHIKEAHIVITWPINLTTIPLLTQPCSVFPTKCFGYLEFILRLGMTLWNRFDRWLPQIVFKLYVTLACGQIKYNFKFPFTNSCTEGINDAKIVMGCIEYLMSKLQLMVNRYWSLDLSLDSKN